MRTCILCLPRTGSQYCENLIASLDDRFILSEYLELWNKSEYVVDHNSMFWIKTRIVDNEEKPITSSSINSEYLDRLELLKKARASQKFTMRLFMFSDYNLEDIVAKLGDMGFDFVNLRRDFYSMAMSYTLGYNYASQGSPIWLADSQISSQVKVDINETKKRLDRIYTAVNDWEDNLTKLNIDCPTLNYNTLVDDITNLFGAVPKYTGIKTVHNNDYLTHIINKDEVLNMMESYISKT